MAEPVSMVQAINWHAQIDEGLGLVRPEDRQAMLRWEYGPQLAEVPNWWETPL